MVRPWCLPAPKSLTNGWPLYFYTIPVCAGHRLVCASVTLQMILTERISWVRSPKSRISVAPELAPLRRSHRKENQRRRMHRWYTIILGNGLYHLSYLKLKVMTSDKDPDYKFYKDSYTGLVTAIKLAVVAIVTILVLLAWLLVWMGWSRRDVSFLAEL